MYFCLFFCCCYNKRKTKNITLSKQNQNRLKKNLRNRSKSDMPYIHIQCIWPLTFLAILLINLPFTLNKPSLVYPITVSFHNCPKEIFKNHFIFNFDWLIDWLVFKANFCSISAISWREQIFVRFWWKF
jgi:hypothetical protein